MLDREKVEELRLLKSRLYHLEKIIWDLARIDVTWSFPGGWNGGPQIPQPFDEFVRRAKDAMVDVNDCHKPYP